MVLNARDAKEPLMTLITNMENYTRTDQYIHWLCQVITKANRSFVTANTDDSHTNLYFDWLGNRIAGRWIETEKSKILLTLNLSNLQFEWLNSTYQTVASFTTIGKKLDEVENEIAGQLGEMGLNSDGFTDKLHYKIPDYPFTNEAIKPVSEKDMRGWIYFRNLANKVCLALLGHLQLEGEIRIWPHHFDTGIYVVTNEGTGIGFGLAMSDSMVGDPYFYMSGYPASGLLEFNDLPALSKGKWEIGEGWKGAVLPLSELKIIPLEKYKDVINDYLLKAVNWFINQK